MVAVIIILVGIALFLIFRKKKKPVVDIETEEEMGSDADLTRLQVYCCGGIELERGKVIIVTEEETSYEVKGFDIKGKEVLLKSNKITWKASCPCVKFMKETGLANVISCSIKGELRRNVSVKYTNGVTFSWKIKFE